MPQILPPKKDVALALLERASVFVHLDPRGDALVPMNFKKQPRLVLQIGLNMAVPIPDLRLDDHGMSCTLSFNRAKFHCVVPWPSVFALVGEDGRGMVWPDDVPREIAGEMAPRTSSAPPAVESSSAGPAGGREGREPGERALAIAPDPQPTGPTGPTIVGKKKPHVSLVGSGRDAKSPKKRAGSRKQDKPALVSVPKAKPTPAVALPPIDLQAEQAERERIAREKLDGPSTSSVGVPAAGSPSSPSMRAAAKSKDDPSPPSPPSNPGSSGPGSSNAPNNASNANKKKAPKRELPPYLRVVK